MNILDIIEKKKVDQTLTKEEIINKIKGISTNYNEPLTVEQLYKKPITWLQKAYNNVVATNNLINIMQVKGSDLEIVDKEKYEYILTYSFPCQDLSLAGKGAGMDLSQAEGGTRSGLLWEIKRILEELKQTNSLPQTLLMENVPMLVSKNNIHNFKKWDNFLTSLGYKNYTECLNAKDYGIPQNRDRCFMVSVLGDYNYNFPRKQKLKLKLKDMLEDEVDEKYYLTEKQIDDIKHWKAYEKPLEQLEKTDKKQVSPTITTRSGAYAAGMILIKQQDMIRKLTPKETTRLMGFEDSDYDAMKQDLSEMAIYHCCGDSIVVNVLESIFKQMIGG